MFNSCLARGNSGAAVFKTFIWSNLKCCRRPRQHHQVVTFNVSGYCQSTINSKRSFSQVHSNTCSGQYTCHSLTPDRTLLKLQGKDTRAFLQGLITNDVESLTGEEGRKALYTHMLNIQGRTLFDIILYSTVSDSLQKHLKVYKIRRKVIIEPCTDLSLWAVLPSGQLGESKTAVPKVSGSDQILVWEPDPRAAAMGWRLIVNKQVNPLEILPASQLGGLEEYHKHRYTIGLPEGVKDLPPGGALPLESNLVYMNGISFVKGCYIGQELTARTHHTGVIRKRLMPVWLTEPVLVPEGAAILTGGGKSAGKLRTSLGGQGLALIRLAQANEPLFVQTSENTLLQLKASVPDWWPKYDKQ
ncbi:putative transferase CAF17-like, mitochondrial [Acipenser ruthenus]|uniref:Putative transferase CAF17-like, mitochondrial n=1 Tax=Acipenser ruthenus TaxID=7906 RepID=A0A444UGB0_ACIRT|nr:putative transferase CAF17-like, mitochondrial [Acipenser ruthenus]